MIEQGLKFGLGLAAAGILVWLAGWVLFLVVAVLGEEKRND